MTNNEFIESIRLEGEIWRDIAGYEGLYMVSSRGRIASLISHLILRPLIISTRKCRYYSVMLHNKGYAKRFLVHRLVAFAFLENPNAYPCIDHINRNGLDNRIENLRWCTRKMNMANEETLKVLAICHDGHDGSYLWRPIVQLKQGEVIKTYQSITAATRDGFAGYNITQVCRGQKKSHRGYQWMYLPDYEEMKREEP